MNGSRTPAAVPGEVAQWPDEEGHGRIAAVGGLHGGTISTTIRIRVTSRRTYVLKQSDDLPDDVYRREAEGLRWIVAAGRLPVPDVLR